MAKTANWAYFYKRSHLNLFLWNQQIQIKPILAGMVIGGTLITLCRTSPPRSLFKVKTKWAQILTSATWHQIIQQIFKVFLWTFFSGSLYRLGIQIRIKKITLNKNLLLRNLSWNDLLSTLKVMYDASIYYKL